MIQIYDAKNTDYAHNGDTAIQPTVCDIDMSLNGEWEMEIEAPADSLGKYRAVLTGNVVKAPTPRGDQLFRIYDHEITEESVIGRARPIFLDAQNEVLLLDTRPTECNGQDALDALCEGTKYSGKSDITDTNTAYYVRKNLIEAIASDDDTSFLNRWGGEIYYDNYTVEINRRVGKDRGLRVEFGRNIQSIKDHGNAEELATRYYPVAFNGRMATTKYFDSPRIGDYPVIYSKVLECQDIKLLEDVTSEPDDDTFLCADQTELDAELQHRCEEMWEKGTDTLATSYDVNMVDLSTRAEYAEYKALEHIELGDTVHVRHKKLGINTDNRVIRVVYDCIRQRNKQLYIGDFRSGPKDYFERLSKTQFQIQDVQDNLDSAKEELNGSIEDAKDELNKSIEDAKQQSANDLKDFMEGDYADTVADLKQQADKKAETWYQPTDPSTTWDTSNDHTGDLWFNTSDQKTYMWDGTRWNETKSTPPDEVFDKIDGKAQIFVGTPTPPYNVNDLWFQGVDSPIRVCIQGRTAEEKFNSADWKQMDFYIDKAAAGEAAQNVMNALDAVAILDKLCAGKQGIFTSEDGKYYINAEAIRALVVDLTTMIVEGSKGGGGITAGQGAKANSVETNGVVLYHGKNVEPPYLIVTDGGIRGQSTSSNDFNMSGGAFEVNGSITTKAAGSSDGHITAAGAISAGGNISTSGTGLYIQSKPGVTYTGGNIQLGGSGPTYVGGNPVYIGTGSVPVNIRGAVDFSDATSVTGLPAATVPSRFGDRKYFDGGFDSSGDAYFYGKIVSNGYDMSGGVWTKITIGDTQYTVLTKVGT